MTKYPEIFDALASPFDPAEVKSRKQAGMQLHYITARTAMNRLDHVLGPENWWDEYAAHENSVLCRLTIRLPDGATLTKSDAGGYAGMADSGDDDKSGYSDAFKRACVKFGVARYLYRDGVPSYAQEDAPPAEAKPKAKARGETWSAYISARLRQANADWLREMTREGVEPDVRQDHRELTNEPRTVNAICTRLIELEKLDAASIAKDQGKARGKDPKARDPGKAREAIRWFFDSSPNAIKKGVEKYLAKKFRDKRAELGMPDPDAHEPAEADPGAPPPGKGDAYEEALSN